MDDEEERPIPARVVWGVTGWSKTNPLNENKLAGLTHSDLRARLVACSRDLESERGRWISIHRTPALPFSVQVRVRRTDEGRLVVTALRLGARVNKSMAAEGDPADEEAEITQRDLRDVKLREILQYLSSIFDEVPPEFATQIGGDWLVGEDALQRTARVRPGPKGHTADFFRGQRLAEAYAQAVKMCPQRPAREVARQLFISEPTARRWIKRARELGVIDTDTPSHDRKGQP